jgi:hypothetical protein
MAVASAQSPACALGAQSSSPPPIGDSCIVGTWTLIDESNTSGYKYRNVPVSVTGLGGAKLTLSADGHEAENFAGSEPLIGTLADGRELSISIGGSFVFRIHAHADSYTETGNVTPLPTIATVDGRSVPDYHSSYAPGSGTYSCSRQSLTMATSTGVQTDHWSRL